MKYSQEDVMQYISAEDVKFVRLAFTDIYGKQKNISIMADELERAFQYGISIDASANFGFGGEIYSDLFLFPDPSTLSVLPWRPEHGKVIRMFCSIKHPDGTLFEDDTRRILKRAIAEAEEQGIHFAFGSEMEFYLFRQDENGDPTKVPYDHAGYMDIAPEDKGENVRREICLTLEQMGIQPERSHHEEGPGQNEIDFRYSDPLTAADNAVTFRAVVNTVAARSGLYADFSPKPLEDQPGNGMHINMSAKWENPQDIMPGMIAGILHHVGDMTAFLNTTEESYKRFGSNKAPRYISWSNENRSQLVRIPAAAGEYRRVELRSPDPLCSPHLAFALMIWASLDGIRNNLTLPPATNLNLYTASEEIRSGFAMLPQNLVQAKKEARNSAFIAEHLPASLIKMYTA